MAGVDSYLAGTGDCDFYFSGLWNKERAVPTGDLTVHAPAVGCSVGLCYSRMARVRVTLWGQGSWFQPGGKQREASSSLCLPSCLPLPAPRACSLTAAKLTRVLFVLCHLVATRPLCK